MLLGALASFIIFLVKEIFYHLNFNLTVIIAIIVSGITGAFLGVSISEKNGAAIKIGVFLLVTILILCMGLELFKQYVCESMEYLSGIDYCKYNNF